MNKTFKPLAWSLLGGGLALVTSAGALDLPWSKSKDKPATQPTPIAAAAQLAPAPALPPGSAPNYRAIVQTYGPAVVGVTVEGLRKTGAEDGSPMAQDPMQRFFRGLPGWRGMPDAQQPFKGQGSGFVVSDDGLILTNAHVVRDAKEVTVRLADRREFSAKVLGSDARTDIAVLRIQAKGLPTVRLGDPKSLMVGDHVLAIGAPYGLEQTATSGIVSAKGRSLPGDAFVPFIQTDAAVNPGNSGGPLFDGAGNVIGINSQIYSRTGGFQGVSFAIPIDVALKVRDQIVATGKAQHARLGVSVQDLNQPLAESFGLKRPDGALVAGVEPKSPAAAAGLKSGDVILQIDGEPVSQAGNVSSRIGLSQPGQKVKLKLWREQAERDVEVTLGAARGEPEVAAAAAAGEGSKLGLALRPLTREERQQSQLEQGLVVQGAQGAAARAGLEQGDVVLAINGKPVNSIDDVRRVLDSKPKNVALLVWREGDRLFVPVPLG
ncbi:Do family serine endopeptidase [Aquincola sp. S2]|uniref:Probable periplasmic serine endoprotease DegP-like n=1 Tax=Pseudaquabacterium terrae TaxID=2732868 RepID=A0ABX2EGV2_9BURK|nr:Do family serine endopeptidase [Aquabacterium terrae]NRF67875.1 Do family serine endopeptidase [Aquabacterium terrae]